MTRKLWIGVDLDATLAEYNGGNGLPIGKPIPAMVERVKERLEAGQWIKIFTARVWNGDEKQIAMIKAWCVEVFGRELEITATKDYDMLEMWDDSCRKVVKNTGEFVK